MLVSIVTPNYNSSKFIDETINSVLAQSYQDWEMLIVDDCSKDNSAETILNYSKKDNRIKLISLKENLGAAEARNIALKEAQGRFIAFCDSDDVWLPHKLERQIQFMLDNKIPISFTEYGVWSEDLSKEYYAIQVPKSVGYQQYLKNTIIGMSTAMIDKTMVETFMFYNIRTRQDTYLWITLLKRGLTAYGIQENLVKYRIRKKSISANKIKAAKRVWFLYYRLEKFSFTKTLYYFFWYGFNAIRKRYN